MNRRAPQPEIRIQPAIHKKAEQGRVPPARLAHGSGHIDQPILVRSQPVALAWDHAVGHGHALVAKVCIQQAVLVQRHQHERHPVAPAEGAGEQQAAVFPQQQALGPGFVAHGHKGDAPFAKTGVQLAQGVVAGCGGHAAVGAAHIAGYHDPVVRGDRQRRDLVVPAAHGRHRNAVQAEIPVQRAVREIAGQGEVP